MDITQFRAEDITDTRSSNNHLNKAKLRRRRYEEATNNKPCTVRAHPDKHESIKKYAKTGRCNNCQELIQKRKDLNAKLDKQTKGPVKWSDELTHRDAVLSIYVVMFTMTFVLIYEVAKKISL